MFSAMIEDTFTQFKYIVYHRRYRSDTHYTIRALAVHTICKAGFYTDVTQTKRRFIPPSFALLLPLIKAVAVHSTAIPSLWARVELPSPPGRSFFRVQVASLRSRGGGPAPSRADSFPEAGCVLASPRQSSSRRRFLFRENATFCKRTACPASKQVQNRPRSETDNDSAYRRAATDRGRNRSDSYLHHSWFRV